MRYVTHNNGFMDVESEINKNKWSDAQPGAPAQINGQIKVHNIL